ncbi:MAG: hypothetical protein MZU95_10025 [Desulfomicrobium escambiense]|nr:hypothetical protein [Desulfomicrobium escambiense]
MTRLDHSDLYDTIIGEVEKALFSIVLKEAGATSAKRRRSWASTGTR